ncbi:MAG: phenylacetic acid degradation protein PaaN, partial [Alcaligenaceae bacterium]|nr:phenylacetic acid degradation protein PaaN [Alcaligenaceae bacterium]
MTVDFFHAHQDTLEQALKAIQTREYWTPFPEMPSPRVYGEDAAAQGQATFEAYQNSTFPLELDGATQYVGQERSPYGFDLKVRYPALDAQTLIDQSSLALDSWREAGPKAWVGVCLEALHRLNKQSFTIANAVQHTSGQAFMMAFQAGGPHAQDRGLEAVTYAWQEMSRIPALANWVKPQGKHDPIDMQKQFTVVPRGIGLVIGCSTFPTWNSYPGLFASLATGNTVIVKPHPGAILPLAITVKILREVLVEAGFNPNVVLLAAHDADSELAQQLSMHPEVKIIDYTGSSATGNYLEQHARQALVYTEKAGVNQIIIDSAPDIKAVARNLAFSFALYSGQMCTAPQNIYVPKDGIQTDEGHLSFDEVCAALGQAVERLCSTPERAVEITGALQNDATAERIQQAKALGLEVIVDSQPLAHPVYPEARTATPLLLKTEATNPQIMQEWF